MSVGGAAVPSDHLVVNSGFEEVPRVVDVCRNIIVEDLKIERLRFVVCHGNNAPETVKDRNALFGFWMFRNVQVDLGIYYLHGDDGLGGESLDKMRSL